MRASLLALSMVCLWPMVSGSLCASSTTVGVSTNLTSVNENVDGISGVQFMAPEYVASCCGMLEGWTFAILQTGSIYLQLWRPDAGTGQYTLLAQKESTYSDTSGDKTVTLASSEQIPVQAGDFIGWYTPGADMVSYKGNGSETVDGNVLDTSGLGLQSVGYTYTPTAAYVVDSRAYAIQATLGSGDNVPSLTNLPASVTIAPSTAVGSSVFTAAATDADTAQVATLAFSATVSPSAVFSVNGSTGEVTTTSTLNAGSYTVTLTVTDACSLNASADLTVLVVNSAPVIASLPASVNVSEDVSVETLLHTVNVTDADGDNVTCSMSAVTPTSGGTKFSVGYIGGSLEQGVYLVANASLDYDSQASYQLDVQCDDGTATSTASLTVSLTANSAPSVSNLPDSVNTSSTAALGTLLFSVTASDSEGDALSFSVNCTDPSSCPFQVDSVGNISLTSSLAGSSTASYGVNVYVSDVRSTSGPYSLTVYVTDLESTPEITNLPQSVSVLESADNSTVLFTVSVNDTDGDTSFTFNATFTPSSGATLFEVNSAGEVRVTSGQSLDFESQPTFYSLELTVSDGSLTSDPATLNLTVVNVNEAPVFNQTAYAISTRENSQGQQLTDPGWQVSDPDGDNVTFTFLGGTGTSWFTLDSTSGLLSFAADYDVDGTSLPTSYVLTVGASDAGGLTATATLTVTITDYNDNRPQFSESSVTVYLYRICDVGTNVVILTASDEDSGNNALLTYSLSQSSLNDNFFGVDTNGRVYTTRSLLSYQGDSTLVVTLIATDQGSPSLSGTATVTIVLYDNTRDFLDYSANIAWFCLLLLLLLLAVPGLIVYYVCTSGSQLPCIRTNEGGAETFARRPPMSRPRAREDYDRQAKRALNGVGPSRSAIWNPWNTKEFGEDGGKADASPRTPQRAWSRASENLGRRRDLNLVRVAPSRAVTPTDVEIAAKWDPWGTTNFEF